MDDLKAALGTALGFQAFVPTGQWIMLYKHCSEINVQQINQSKEAATTESRIYFEYTV